MEEQHEEPTESYFPKLACAFDEAALDFAKLCLLQPESTLAEDEARVYVKPDGYNFGPESFADMSYIEYDDIAFVLPIVTYWCRLNSIELTITFSEESYVCRGIEGSPLRQVAESNGSDNLCFELFVVCTALSKYMKNINPPRPSMRTSDFSDQQP